MASIIFPNLLLPDDVRTAQRSLAQAGFYYGKIDGIWGEQTESAWSQYRAAKTHGAALVGDGTWPWQAQIVGEDIVLFGFATCFGGAADPQDNGDTASGLNTKKTPSILGCSLPMDGRQFKGLTQAEHRALDGCPLPKMPFKTTMVRVTVGGKTQELPVIDLGPGKQATKKPSEPHVIDLTVAAARKFDPRASATDCMLKVEAVIIGAAKYTG